MPWYMDGEPVSRSSEAEQRQEAAEAAAARMRRAVSPDIRPPMDVPEHLQSWSKYGAHAWEKAKEQAIDLWHHPEDIIGPGELGAPVLGMVRSTAQAALRERIMKFLDAGRSYEETASTLKVSHEEIVAAVREARQKTALPQKISRVVLEKREPYTSPDGYESYKIDIKTPEGVKVGEVHVSHLPEETWEGNLEPETIFINWIEAGVKGGAPNVLGPRATASILRGLKTMFPSAKRIAGDRISGARQMTGETGYTSIDFQPVEHDPFAK